MKEINIFTIIASLVIAILQWYIIQKLSKRDKKQDELEQARKMEAYLLLKNVKAQGGVIEKIAVCVKNRSVNGDMDAAMVYHREQKHELENFLDNQAVQATR